IETHGTPQRDQGGSVCRGPPRVRGPRSRRPAGVLAGTIRRHARGGGGERGGGSCRGGRGGVGRRPPVRQGRRGGRRRGRAAGVAVGVAGLAGWPSVRSSSAKWWESGRLNHSFAEVGARWRPVAADGAR